MVSLHTHTAQCCIKISNIPQLPPLSVSPEPHPSASRPHLGRSGVLPFLTWAGINARQFHKVSLSVWTMFLSISFQQPNSNSKKKQPLTETRAVISTVIYTHTEVWSWRDKPVTHAHWHMMATHRNVNSSLQWGALKEKGFTEIDLLLPETGSII